MSLRRNINSVIFTFLILANLLFIKINYDLYSAYKTATGKNKALFGLQYMQYFYVVYIFAVEVFTFLFMAIVNKNKRIIYFSLYLIVLSSILIFIQPWKYFI
jgi:hypothetical protein